MINYLKYLNIKDLYFKYSNRIIKKTDVYNNINDQTNKKKDEQKDVYEKSKDRN